MNKIKPALLRKMLFLTFLILFVILVVVIYTKPILGKYLAGSARFIGKPESFEICANGNVSDDIKVYKVYKNWNNEPANYYLLYFDNADINLISLNLNDGYIGIPISTSKENYDIIFGRLFQGEVGAYFTPIDNKIKGFGFNTELVVTENKVRFKLMKEHFGIDSISIELN